MAVKKTTATPKATENNTDEEVTAKEEKAVKTENTAPETGEETQLVYIGPSLPKGQLKSNTIFAGTREDIMKNVAGITEKIPLVEKMFVPVSELADKKQRVKTEGNIYNKFYKDIASAAIKLLEEE